MRLRTNLKMPDAIVTYINRHVFRLDPLTGETLWRTKLPKTWTSTFGTLVIDGDVVIVSAAGRVYCLDLEDGRIIWRNDLPNMGLGLATIATTNASGDPVQPAQQAANAQAAAAAAACTAAAVS